MARKPREQNEEQGPEPYQSAPAHAAEVIDASVELINPSPMRPSAAARDGSMVEVEPPPRYRVVASQYIMSKGGRTLLRAGKIVDSHGFDLPALVSQGVQLEAVA
jgi:hypothetical protein